MRKLNPGQVTSAHQRLFQAAFGARKNAYAIYSNFKVGAAVETERAIYVGCNVENSSSPMSMCAERVAIGRMITDEGPRAVIARLCVVLESTDGDPGVPCGGCLQVINEFAETPNIVILIANPVGEMWVTTLRELLPHGFSMRPLAPHR